MRAEGGGGGGCSLPEGEHILDSLLVDGSEKECRGVCTDA